MKFFDYFKGRIKYISLILFCSVLNAGVLLIYQCEVEPVLYALVIYLCFLLVCGGIDFYQQRKKHRILKHYAPFSEAPISTLIQEKDLVRCDYQALLEGVTEEIQKERSEQNTQNKELSDFYTLWVHQIKTPIAALQLLLQTDPEKISDMKSELFKIDRYVDIILGYLRMENINQDLEFQHYPLEIMVKQAVRKYAPLFIKSHLSLKMEHLDISVLTDEKWLVFVIEQLLSNAIKYTPSGEIRIFADRQESDGIRSTRLYLQDTGIGIHPEDLPRIFERSFTGYNGRMDKKASGLGLYLCNTILKKLGHSISVDSIPKEGTTVTILFQENLNY
ncbi:MAG: sensor histidine kinase [Lachnospiraceae bacterium]|nr:sensor histidine kinase [Lachnospiraceae bacterium]